MLFLQRLATAPSLQEVQVGASFVQQNNIRFSQSFLAEHKHRYTKVASNLSLAQKVSKLSNLAANDARENDSQIKKMSKALFSTARSTPLLASYKKVCDAKAAFFKKVMDESLEDQAPEDQPPNNLVPQDVDGALDDALVPQDVDEPVVNNLAPQDVDEPVVNNLAPQSDESEIEPKDVTLLEVSEVELPGGAASEPPACWLHLYVASMLGLFGCDVEEEILH